MGRIALITRIRFKVSPRKPNESESRKKQVEKKQVEKKQVEHQSQKIIREKYFN